MIDAKETLRDIVNGDRPIDNYIVDVYYIEYGHGELTSPFSDDWEIDNSDKPDTWYLSVMVEKNQNIWREGWDFMGRNTQTGCRVYFYELT